jgi:hypothetical protein
LQIRGVEYNAVFSYLNTLSFKFHEATEETRDNISAGINDLGI